jgi:hypothetical protein
LQRLWVHGVGIDVPASWPRNALKCGIPTMNTVVVTTLPYGHRPCAATEPTGLSFAWLGSFRDSVTVGSTLGALTVDRTHLDELHKSVVNHIGVLRGVWRTAAGEPLTVLVLPQRHVYVFIATPDRQLYARTLLSLQLVAVDPDTGCEVFTRDYDDAASLSPSVRRPLVPPAVSSVDACYYVDGWLEATASLDGEDAQSLARSIDGAPTGRVSHRCDTFRQGGLVLTGPMVLRFHDGADLHTAVARVVSCHGWDSYVTNGAVTHAIDRATLRRIPRLWGYAAPDHLR